jgi:molybdopterin converting factor small subunit
MSVKVDIHPLLHTFTGGEEAADVSGNTVTECLDHLVELFPGLKSGLFEKDGRLRSFVDIYVNKELVRPDQLGRPVKPGDEISLLVMIAGG